MRWILLSTFFYRFNYHLEKVRDIVNNAFTSLHIDSEDNNYESMEIDDELNSSHEKSINDSVDPNDRIMCKIVDEIKFSP